MTRRRRSSTSTIAKAGDGMPIDADDQGMGRCRRRRSPRRPVRIEHDYKTPREYQVPIEPHGLIAQWEGDSLTVWEPSQWIDGMARTYAEWFGVPFENVRLISPYIGGGFGSKALALSHGAIAAMAAKMLDRPVKLVITRPQTFTGYGGRAGDAPDDGARRHAGRQAPVDRASRRQ